jgi:hypothetical protein
MPITVNAGSAPIAADDVYLVNRSAYLFSPPKPGDIVLHWGDTTRLQATGHTQFNITGGDRIDRILAGPGSEARWEDGRLFVDGVESPLRPLNPSAAPVSVTVNVPQGYYFILTTTLPLVDGRVPPEFWKTMSLVPVRNIRGTVYLRTQPFSRFGTIH